MGTSQSINTGVKGEPQWGKASSNISHLANTIEKETNKPELKDHVKFQERKSKHLRRILNNYTSALGGKQQISRGKSSRGGKAAVKGANGLISFLVDASTGKSFVDALKNIGFTDLIGKSKKELTDFLIEHFCEATSTMDDAAAKCAMGDLLDSIFDEEEAGVQIEEVMNERLSLDKLEPILIKYFGSYIFEHLTVLFEEKLFLNKGKEICYDTFSEIKEFIVSEVEVLSEESSITSVDWLNDHTRETTIQNIFYNVLEIFDEDED